MRCKKHSTDFSSSVGVCATCLRDRLFALITAQVQAQARAQAQAQAQTQAAGDDHRKSDAIPPPLIFPRSVSPYITRRKSDTATVNAATTTASTWHHHQHLRLPDQKFFSTPQLGPTGGAVTASVYKKKSTSKFSLISKLFRSKSVKPGADSDPRVSDSGEVCSTSSSPAWFSTILPGRRKNQMRTFSLDETAIRGQRKTNRNRGMSPAMYSDDEEDNEHCQPGSSGYSSESSQGWKQTPRRTPAHQRRGGGRPNHNRNVSGIAFCLSPLVRASPSRFWNQKGVVPPEVAVSGQIRPPVKPHLTSGTSFCKNRSKKLADFGRFNRNH